jgi:hypothetical protein
LQLKSHLGVIVSEKWVRVFFLSSGVTLAITGGAKLLSAGGSAIILQRLDPVFGISFRTLFCVVGICEMIVAALCLFSKRIVLQAAIVAWMATSFGVYRLSLWWIGYQKPCQCLGSLTETLHISPTIADVTMKCILAYLIAGSYAALLWLWVRYRKELT